MKSSEEMVRSLLARRDEYNEAQKRKKQAFSHVIKSKAMILCACVTVFLAIGVVLIKSFFPIVTAEKTQPTEYRSSVTSEVYCVSNTLPAGYRYFYPAYDLSEEEWNMWLSTERDHAEILVKKGEDTAMRIAFEQKVLCAIALEEMKEQSAMPPGSEDFSLLEANKGWSVSISEEGRLLDPSMQYTILSAVRSPEMNYVIYYATNPRQRGSEYYGFLGAFNVENSLAAGFSIKAYTSLQEAQTLFDSIGISFVRNYTEDY